MSPLVRSSVPKVPEELLKPTYLLLEPVRYTLAEILRLCRRPMVLPGPLVKSMLQDLLGAVTICHDRNIVIKSLDAEKVGHTFRFDNQRTVATVKNRHIKREVCASLGKHGIGND